MTICDLTDPANVPNLRIHFTAGLKKAEFIKRVASVRAIRRVDETRELTWYPTTAREWTLWEGIHNAVNKGGFENVGVRDGHYAFGIILPRAIFNLFERNDLAIIQRQVIAYLASILAFDPEGEKFIPDQVFRPVAEQAQRAREKLFKRESFADLSWEDFLPRMNEAFLDYTGASTFEFLQTPPCEYQGDEVTSRWWIEHEFYLGYGSYYFTEADWKTLIVEKSEDSLMRSESEKDLWELWLHAFKAGELNLESEASFFAAPPTRGLIYVIRQQGTNHYKIGWTTSEDPKVRLATLQTGSPQKLELVGAFPVAARSTETTLHRLFASHRKSGEWFTLTDDQVTELLSDTWRQQQQLN